MVKCACHTISETNPNYAFYKQLKFRYYLKSSKQNKKSPQHFSITAYFPSLSLGKIRIECFLLFASVSCVFVISFGSIAYTLIF